MVYIYWTQTGYPRKDVVRVFTEKQVRKRSGETNNIFLKVNFKVVDTRYLLTLNPEFNCFKRKVKIYDTNN